MDLVRDKRGGLDSAATRGAAVDGPLARIRHATSHVPWLPTLGGRAAPPSDAPPPGDSKPTGRVTAFLSRRPYLAPVTLALAMALAAVVVAAITDLPLRDPDGVFGERMRLMLGTVLAFVAVDIVPRALVRAGWRPQDVLRSIRTVARERYTRRRTVLAITGVLAFYVTYVAYRNLKSYLPILAEQDLDRSLLDIERSLLFGNDPAELLQGVLGTGAVAHVLSWVYLFFLAFVPISVGVASIWSRRYGAGFWYTMALGLNWTLGVASYYIVPTLGPIFVFPGLFDALPATGVSDLQEVLIIERALVTWDADATTSVQSIAGFASLHVSIVFTAALIAQLLRLPRLVTGALWAFLTLTVLATVYFGWHYVVDDIAGFMIGGVSVYVGALATGQPLRRRASHERQGDVVAGDDRERHRVDSIEDAAVGAEGAPRVLDARVALEERLEEVAGGRGHGDGQPHQHRFATLKRRVAQRHEQPQRDGSDDDAR